MATATVTLNVAGNAATQLNKVQKQVDTLGKSFNGLRNILGTLAVGTLVTNMFRAADALNDVSDATGLATSTIQGLSQAFIMSGGTAEQAQNSIIKLYQSIDEAAGGNDKLIKSFEKVGISLTDLGNLSEEEILNRVIANLGKLGNNSEAIGLKMDLLGKQARGVNLENVANQFGRLSEEAKGAEPAIASIGKIFDNIDKFKGEFGVELGKQFSGLLTTLEKLTSNTESLAKTLAELVKIVTILGGAFLIFGKVIPAIKTVGDALKVSGAAAGFFGKQFRLIFVNMVGFFKNIGAWLTSLVGLQGAFATLAKRAGGLASLGFALLNILRILLRFAGVAGLIYGVAQALNFLIKVVTGFDVLDWLGNKISNVIEKFKEFLGLLLYSDSDAFKQVKEDVAQVSVELEEVTTTAAATRDRLAEIRKENEKLLTNIRDTTEEYKKQNKETLDSLDNQLKYLNMTDEQIALDEKENEILKQRDAILTDLFRKQREAMDDPSQGQAVADRIQSEIDAVNASAAATVSASKTKIAAYYEQLQVIRDTQNAIEDLGRGFTQAEALQDLEDQLSLVGLYGKELEKQQTILAAEKALRQEMQALTIQLLDLETQRTRIGEVAYNKERARITQQMMDTKALSEAKIAAFEKEQQRKQEIEQNYSEGVKRALEDMADQFKPINMAQEAVKKGWDNISDAVDTFVETGKFKFKDFAKSVLQDLAKMIIKAQIFKAISGIAGAFGLKLPGLATGGPAEKGQPYIVGEKGPELFIPQTSGTVVPNNKLNQGMSAGAVSAPVTNNYITNNISALDAKSVAQLFAENRKALFGANEMARREMPYGAR